MTIEVGKTYLDGRGQRVEIECLSGELLRAWGWPFCGRDEDGYGAYYDTEGRWDSTPSGYDLIRLAPELDTPHTDADLAMALELARMMDHESLDSVIYAVTDWLRAEVTRTLLERGQR